MAKIVHKKSSVAGKVPLPADLDYGELAINYADSKIFFKDSSNVVRTLITAVPPVQNRQVFNVTGSQTVFNFSYTPGYIDVYLNGVKLVIGDDFTANNGSTITLTNAATTGDVLDAVAGIFFTQQVASNDFLLLNAGII